MDDYRGQIEAGKQIITDYLQKERPDYAERINWFGWVPRSSDDITFGIHRLVIYISTERYTIKFEEVDLADAPATLRIFHSYYSFYRSFRVLCLGLLY